mgnify:CR=1 FL=1
MWAQSDSKKPGMLSCPEVKFGLIFFKASSTSNSLTEEIWKDVLKESSTNF